jgi:thiamine pyrophosphate-dependent acetolactate synthase large subunit-like protein
MSKRLGAYAEYVADPKEIRPSLERAKASGRPSVKRDLPIRRRGREGALAHEVD